MFTDPLVVTIATVAKTLPRINNDAFASEYLMANGTETVQMNIKHIKESAKAGTVPFDRHTITLTHTTLATPTTFAVENVCSFQVRTRKSSDPAEALKAVKALIAFCTDTNLAKLIAWES